MRAWLWIVAWAALTGTAVAQDATYQGKTVQEWAQVLKSNNAQQRFQGVIDELAGKEKATGPTLGKYTLYKNDMITDNAQRATCAPRPSALRHSHPWSALHRGQIVRRSGWCWRDCW